MLGWLRRTLTLTLDLDWLYRRLAPRLAARAALLLSNGLASSEIGGQRAWIAIDRLIRRLHGPQGVFGRTWPSGAMGVGVMSMLLALLLSYYLFQ
jgi:multicomponent Na+:H+ antiporter subunit D